MDETTQDGTRSLLIIGASRGLGHAIAEDYAARGAQVVGTVRGTDETPLHVSARSSERIEIEHVDIDHPSELDALADRLDDRRFDVLFVVAGISLAPMDQIAADSSDGDFERMMLTNVLSVVRTVERLQELVSPTGTIAVMSSGQGSITNNTSGGFEVYRATKSALNQLMRSYAARHAEGTRALLLMAPGWVRTELGGPQAALDIDESIPPLIDAVEAQHGTPGLRFLDRHGVSIPW